MTLSKHRISQRPTRYAVVCRVHGTVYLTSAEYNRQMLRTDALWECPHEGCDEGCTFDDDNYDDPLRRS